MDNILKISEIISYVRVRFKLKVPGSFIMGSTTVLDSELEFTVELVVKKGTRECHGKTGIGLASLQAREYKKEILFLKQKHISNENQVHMMKQNNTNL